jgi:hypothetical protein
MGDREHGDGDGDSLMLGDDDDKTVLEAGWRMMVSSVISFNAGS